MNTKRGNGDIRIELMDDITFANASRLKKEMLRQIDEDVERVIINISQVEFMDSSGIGVLISLYKIVESMGGQLIIEHPNLGVQKLFEMTKLDEILDVRKVKEQTTGSWEDFDD
ncbi:MAG: STAS domain-containing protein [Clostridiales bacterium]|nr:STAS domain-containing protein [Clostridiales bacterium]